MSETVVASAKSWWVVREEPWMAMRMVRTVATTEATTTLASHLGFAAVLIVAGWATMTLGLFTGPEELAVFFAGIGMIYTHVKRITTAINQVQESAGAADRLHSILEERQDIVERADAHAVTSLGSGIDFEAAQESMRLFAAEILPELKSWDMEPATVS